MSTEYRFVATVPRGFSDLLAAEVTALGAQAVRESTGGVTFSGSLACGYRVLLESRLASRVLLEVARGAVANADDLYALARGIDWREHLDPRGTLACEFTGQHPAFRNTHFGALKLKDAIVDQLRETTKQRPTVETQRPDLSVLAHAARGEVAISIDLAGVRRFSRIEATSAVEHAARALRSQSTGPCATLPCPSMSPCGPLGRPATNSSSPRHDTKTRLGGRGAGGAPGVPSDGLLTAR